MSMTRRGAILGSGVAGLSAACELERQTNPTAKRG